MASEVHVTYDDGGPATNSDMYRSPDRPGELEETVEEVKNLIQLNQDLKAACQSNLIMKKQFEVLSAWKERRQQEQQVLESQLEETRRCVATLTLQNQELQEWLAAAEEDLVAKQRKIDEMEEEMVQKEKELETMSVLRAQAEVYSSDFYAERAAREKLHEEKDHLVSEVENLREQNMQLQEEMVSMQDAFAQQKAAETDHQHHVQH
ncbi:optineurin-like isoform X2 [Fundulus heteroclitus]|uniref:optineurin-like isoform X2 n=1 Tax=Fundulus heteroclitus TaxID=8078 RepID=UPI00165C228E|nr:optineurin-like isoform X2 [Fundulus heteroclitus]